VLGGDHEVLPGERQLPLHDLQLGQLRVPDRPGREERRELQQLLGRHHARGTGGLEDGRHVLRALHAAVRDDGDVQALHDGADRLVRRGGEVRLVVLARPPVHREQGDAGGLDGLADTQRRLQVVLDPHLQARRVRGGWKGGGRKGGGVAARRDMQYSTEIAADEGEPGTVGTARARRFFSRHMT
jgi:hypothetical protein